MIEKLKQIPVAVVDTIKDLAYKIEEKRQEIITGYYLLAHNDETMEGAAQYVAKMEPLLSDYMENHDKLVTVPDTGTVLLSETRGRFPCLRILSTSISISPSKER